MAPHLTSKLMVNLSFHRTGPVNLALTPMLKRSRLPVPSGPTPEELLSTRWRLLDVDDLARYLRRVIVTERRCISGRFTRLVMPRLRWRRLAVASRLRTLGHPVEELVFRQPNARAWSSGERRPNVPQRYSWRGVFSLVPTPAAQVNRPLHPTAFGTG